MEKQVFHVRSSAAAALVALVTATPLGAQQQDITATSPKAQYSHPAGFQQMVADKLPAVVGILSTAPQQPTAPTMEPPDMPSLPPGFEEFFGGPDGGMPRGPRGPLRSQGSGFFISADGYVVTNNHVVQGAERVEVVMDDQTRLRAEVVGTDPATDLALLKVEPDDAVPFVEWGASADLRIGEWLVAIGNPFGLSATVTAGILSARARDIRSGPYDDFLQTDAAINRGNSGGPLFNTEGEVVGVNTAIFSPTGGSVGIGFAIPSQVAMNVVAELREDGKVERGYLGVQLQPVDEALAEALGLAQADAGGALVADVTEGSPAAEAGLRAGDLIVSVAGETVTSPRELSFSVAALEAGTEADMTILRDGEEMEITVTIGEQPAGFFTGGEPAQPQPEEGEARLGVAVTPLDNAMRERLGLPQNVEGLYVASVQPGTPAAEAGLAEGDVISAAGGEQVSGVDGLRAAAAEAEQSGRPLLLRIYREGGYAFVAVPVGDLPEQQDDAEGADGD